MNVIKLPDSITDILAVHTLGVLATCSEGHPHSSLITIAFLPDYSGLLFPTLRSTRKYANMLENSRVSILLDNRSVEKHPNDLYALTIFGIAKIVDVEQHPLHANRYLQFHPHLSDFLDLPDTAMIRVHVEKICMVERFDTKHEYLVSDR